MHLGSIIRVERISVAKNIDSKYLRILAKNCLLPIYLQLEQSFNNSATEIYQQKIYLQNLKAGKMNIKHRGNKKYVIRL